MVLLIWDTVTYIHYHTHPSAQRCKKYTSEREDGSQSSRTAGPILFGVIVIISMCFSLTKLQQMCHNKSTGVFMSVWTTGLFADLLRQMVRLMLNVKIDSAAIA